MKLTRAQRALLFAGTPPKITFDGKQPCPIPIGHVEVLSAHVRLEVTGHRRTKQGEHALVYTLHNNRLGQRYLSTRRGDEHGYAYSGGSDTDHEAGEAVDEFTQRRLTQESKQREREAMGDLLASMEIARDAMERAALEHPTIRRELYTVRSRIVEVQRKLRRKLAA